MSGFDFASNGEERREDDANCRHRASLTPLRVVRKAAAARDGKTVAETDLPNPRRRSKIAGEAETGFQDGEIEESGRGADRRWGLESWLNVVDPAPVAWPSG